MDALLNQNPSTRWTTQKVLAKLQRDGFTFKAKKPVISIGQALTKLVAQDKIRRVRRGSGSEPNIYAGKIVKSPQPILDLSGVHEEERKDSHLKN